MPTAAPSHVSPGQRASLAVLAVTATLVALILAGQAGLLPRAPLYAGDPAVQYLSPQSRGMDFTR